MLRVVLGKSLSVSMGGAQVVFGGSVAYVPQTAWIRNATLRENVVFGQEDDDARCVCARASGSGFWVC